MQYALRSASKFTVNAMDTFYCLLLWTVKQERHTHLTEYLLEMGQQEVSVNNIEYNMIILQLHIFILHIK